MIDVKGKRIFLSGPMSDDPKTYHAHEFIDAHIALMRAGAECVYNPAIEWLQTCGEKGHAYYMRVCINELTGVMWDGGGACYDMLLSMPGWAKSTGALLERIVADECGIEVHDLTEVISD